MKCIIYGLQIIISRIIENINFQRKTIDQYYFNFDRYIIRHKSIYQNQFMKPQKGMTFLIFLALVLVSTSLPSKFDLRAIPSISMLTDYAVKPQGVCLGQGWAQQIAQALSNAQSLTSKMKVNLSGRQLLECTQSITNKCHDISLDNIHKGLQYIKKQGLTEAYCYPNHILSLPKSICSRVCEDGYQFPFNIKAKVELVNLAINRQQILKAVGQLKGSLIIIYKLTDSMNYYSSQTGGKSWTSDKFYGYGVSEVVGWRNKGQQLIIRSNFGSNWGYMGHAYINIDINPSFVEEAYMISSLDIVGSQQ